MESSEKRSRACLCGRVCGCVYEGGGGGDGVEFEFLKWAFVCINVSDEVMGMCVYGRTTLALALTRSQRPGREAGSDLAKRR